QAQDLADQIKAQGGVVQPWQATQMRDLSSDAFRSYAQANGATADEANRMATWLQRAENVSKVAADAGAVTANMLPGVGPAVTGGAAAIGHEIVDQATDGKHSGGLDWDKVKGAGQTGGVVGGGLGAVRPELQGAGEYIQQNKGTNLSDLPTPGSSGSAPTGGV